MKKLLEIVLGSTSDIKINALREACEKSELKACVLGVKALSGQNEQPVGLEETLAGALARANSAKNQMPDSIAIGIENGIVHIKTDPSTSARITLDIAIVVILNTDGRQIVTTSTGIEFPQKYVMIAQEEGFEITTVGSVIADHLGGETTDPHSTLTAGKVTRMMTLVEALIVALKQL